MSRARVSPALWSEAMQRSRAQSPAPSPAPPAEPEPFASVGHESLFEQDVTVVCDACGQPMPAEDDGYELTGEGEYVWTRGDEVRREKAPLCPACASAIFGAAISTWDLEDEG